MLDPFLKSHQFPGLVLIARVSGSRGYNLQKPTSDWDFAGVYAAPLQELSGLNPPPERISGKDPDFCFYEVGHFARLLSTGNPVAIEALFCEQPAKTHDLWKTLWKNRTKFLSQQTIEQHCSYAYKQLCRLQKKQGRQNLLVVTDNEKWAYHIIRILLITRDIAAEIQPVMSRVDTTHNLLLAIRNGKWSMKDIVDYAQDIISDINNLKPWRLPAIGDIKYLEEWLWTVRSFSLFGMCPKTW